MGSSALGKLETLCRHARKKTCRQCRPISTAQEALASHARAVQGASKHSLEPAGTTHAGSTGGLSDPYGLQGRRKKSPQGGVCHLRWHRSPGRPTQNHGKPPNPWFVFRGRGFERGCRDGGFNFQAAWTTGHLAGSALARRWLAEHP